jgi:type II secretory ATPase GspE/PulE/Tfp pilus assembly ATPase PilB-like protein
MKDVEITVFNDKSWVRLIEYQKLKNRYEALEETKEYQNDEICRLQKQIEKMKCCENCKHHSFWGNELKCNLLDYDTELECLKSKNKWELING